MYGKPFVFSLLALGVDAQGLIPDINGLLNSLGPAPADDPRFTNFKAPGKNDVRSPCPGLNTLANHGFIHHDGRNMTLPHLLEGLAAGMNMGPDFTVAIGGAGLLSSNDPESGAFDLDDLDQHNFPIEHDSSLSRQDYYFNHNEHSFYPPNWNKVKSFFKGMEKTSIPVASKAKFSRFQQSNRTNPEFTYGPREYIFSYGETAIYLQTMSDPYSGMAEVKYVRSLFEKEKLPYNLGWRPSTQPITLTTLGAMVFQLGLDSPEPVPEGLTVLKNSYKDALIAVAGGSKFLNELTGGLAAAVGLA